MRNVFLPVVVSVLSASALAGGAADHWDVSGSFGRFDGEVETRPDGFAAACGGCRLETKVAKGPWGVTSRTTTLVNTSGVPVSARCLLDRFVFDGDGWEVYTQANVWQHESSGAWQPLNTTVEARGSGMRDCEGAAPVLAVWDRVARRGRVFHLLGDGQWILRASRTAVGGECYALAVEAGFDPRQLDCRLAPGEKVTFPEILEYAFENRDDLDCHRLHAYWNRRCPARFFPAVYNTWLCRFDKLELDFMLRQVARAKEIGFDYFVVDAGWFGPAENWGSVRGDWEERPDGYLKGRLAEVSKAVRAAGMKFGFWLEAESAQATSKVVREHPDWFVKLGNEHYLDFRKPAAFEHMLATTCALVRKYDASYLKFDFNQNAWNDTTGRAFSDYKAAYRRFVRMVRERNPGIYILGCAGGGMMMDLGWAQEFDSFWPTDNQSIYHSFRIAKETMLRLPPRMIDRWLTLRRADGLQPDYFGNDSRLLSTDDATWSRMRSTTLPTVDAFTAGGAFAMSCDLTAFSAADVGHFRALVAERRREGDFWRNAVGRIVADTPSVTALQYSDEALKDIRLVVVPHRPLARACTVRPVVDPSVAYGLGDERRAGRDLAENGLAVSVAGDQPQVLRLLGLGPAKAPAAAASAVCAAATPSADRARMSLDGTWDFAFRSGETLAMATDTFAATDKMVVPGCFDLMPKWYARRGLAHYRRTFSLAADVPAAFLTVKGMGLQAKFFVDGRDVGTVKYPFLAFELPVGPLKAGEHTVVAALDNNLLGDPGLVFKPNYDFFLSGGFYHGVGLRLQYAPVELDRVVVRTRDYATGTVELALEAKGELPSVLTAEVTFDSGVPKKVAFAQGRARIAVPAFRLWSPERPNLHAVTVSSAFGTVTTRFGIRQVAARGKAIFLNGEKVWLRGVNRHDSDPEAGYATTRALMCRDIQLMKSLGCNYVRGSHYPQCEEFLDLCDEMGLMVWEESLGWGNWNDLGNAAFAAAQVEQTRQMARNSINHPSVVISAFLNEFGANREDGKALAAKLAATIRAEDTGHLVTYATMVPRDDISADCVDLIAFNSYPAWHMKIGTAGTPESLGKVIREEFDGAVKALRERYGEDKPIIVGETGCYSLYGNHDPMGAQWSEEFQAEYLGHWLACVTASPEMAGFTVWQFCDARTFFRGGDDIRHKPMGYNMAGLFDGHRNAKLAAQTVRRYYAGKHGH